MNRKKIAALLMTLVIIAMTLVIIATIPITPASGAGEPERMMQSTATPAPTNTPGVFVVNYGDSVTICSVQGTGWKDFTGMYPITISTPFPVVGYRAQYSYAGPTGNLMFGFSQAPVNPLSGSSNGGAVGPTPGYRACMQNQRVSYGGCMAAFGVTPAVSVYDMYPYTGYYLPGNIGFGMNKYNPTGGECFTMSNVDVAYYGSAPLPTTTPSPTISPTPTQKCAGSLGNWRTVDLLKNGILINGSLNANQAIIDNEVFYVIDFTIQANLPKQSLDGYQAASISVGIDDPGTHMSWIRDSRYSVTVNGVTQSQVVAGVPGPISVAMQGTNQITLTYHAEIAGSPSSVDTMSAALVSARVPSYWDDAQNLLCDGGMEQYPGSNAWELVTVPGVFGRLNDAYQSWLDQQINGTAYCQSGLQAVGSFRITDQIIIGQDYSGGPVLQNFYWPGGTIQYKFRYRVGAFGGEPYVWIRDNAGTNVHTLMSNELVVGTDWAIKTGSFTLAGPSYYQIVLDGVLPNQRQTVYYDDVALGTNIDPVDCQEDIEVLPTIDTPTATPTNQTKTPTLTLALTQYHTPSPSVTGTGTTTRTVTVTALSTVTGTRTGTPTGTRTGTPSRTATITRTASPVTPSPTGASGNETATAAASTATAVAGQTSVASTATQQAIDNGGDYPGDGDTGSGDCNRPTNQWSLAWWLDYEVCRVLYAFSWQPGHSATVVALPAVANTYQPFQTIHEIQVGVSLMKTEIATAVAGQTPFVNSGGPQTPVPGMFVAPANSVWNGKPFTIDSWDPKKQTASLFSTYCTSKMITVLGTTMAPGFCYTLNMLRDLGILIWFQLVIDIFAIGSVMRQILVTIKFYPLMMARSNGSSGSSNEN